MPKRLNKFLIAFSFCTVCIIGVIWACADSDESDYSAFAPEYFVNKQYSPFFYASNEVYYGLGYAEGSNERYNQIITDEWYEHFSHKVDKNALEYLLLKATTGGIDSVYKNLNGDIKALPSSFPVINPGNISKKDFTAFLNYLKLAKSCETFTVNPQEGSWEKVTPLHAPADLETKLSNVFTKETDKFVKERLWFQLVRYYYFSESKTDRINTVNVFNKYKDQFPKNLIYYRALGYVAGYYYSNKNYALSNYLYSLCYNYSYDLKIPSFWSFHPQNETDWNATLNLAKSDEEKITLWQMLGVEYDSNRAIRKIADINPKAEKLDLLLSRLINIRENDLRSKNKLPDSLKQSYTNDKLLVEGIARKNSTNKPYYWNLAAGYLNFLDSNYMAAGKFYAIAKKQFPASDNMIVAQSKLLDILLYVKKLNKIDASTEKQLTEPLNWLADLRDEKTKIKNLRFNDALSNCVEYLSKLYQQQGEFSKEVCFGNSNSNRIYVDSTQTESLIKLLVKPDKTPFEQAMMRYYKYTTDDLYYHQAIMLVYKERTKEAIKYLLKRKTRDSVLYGNPFNGRLVDCHDCDHAAPQKQKFTPLSFLQTLQNIETEIKSGKDLYRNAFLMANAYYNITYYGNARLFYESDPFGDSSDVEHSAYSDELFKSSGSQYVSMRIAAKYYQLARTNAATDEGRARCTFMLSKCALNEIYNLPNYEHPQKFVNQNSSQAIIDKYYNYFAELKRSYNKTSFYKEAIGECGYFKTYVNKR